MSELDALLVNASNNTAGVFGLSADTLAVLFFALGLAQNKRVWRDYSGEEISDADWDTIIELLDWANDELMREVSTVPVGAIMMWQEVIPPTNWLVCDGSAAFVAEWPELFAIWEYKYGGAGSQFGLPDFSDYSPMGAGGNVSLDDTAGSETHTLTIAQMPPHAHRVQKRSGTLNAAVNTATPEARTDNPAAPHMMTDEVGGGLPHNNIHPVFGTNYIVYGGKRVS